MNRLLFVLIAGLLSAGNILAHTRLTSSTGQTPRWAGMPIGYAINDRGRSIPNGSDFVAMHEAFRTWESVPSAQISFAYQGVTAESEVGHDGINLLTFSDSSMPLGSGTLAVTLVFYGSTGGTLAISEADVLFNPAECWTTSGEGGCFDIQGILTHELGHFLGLAHSGMVSSVMTPYASANPVHDRFLQFDDIAGITSIYPGTLPPSGSVRGFIRSSTQPIFGAHVVAVDSNGTPRVSALSQKDGSYVIPFLPPDNYRIYAEPLDGPVDGGNLSSWYDTIDTNFGTTYFGNASVYTNSQTVSVGAGSTPAVADIQVFPANTSGLNISGPGYAVRVARGGTGSVTLRGTDLRAGLLFSSSNSAVQLGSPVYGSSSSGTTARLSVTPSTGTFSSAPLGPKNISANRGTDLSIASGVIIVTDPPPTVSSVSPASGVTGGGEHVVILGDDFRPGVRVFFAGLPSAQVQVVSSTMLDVVTPANTAGSANVQVVNSDSTNGILRNGYIYEAPAIPQPRISSISPDSGPAGLVVTIDGTGFGSDPTATIVSFGADPAYVFSVTPTRIEARVPNLPESSTPVRVQILGIASPDLPTFTVTAPDLTQPLPPIVIDGGAVANSTSELSASWYSEDPEVGIREYQYTIGTTPGSSDVYPNQVFTTRLNYATVRDLNLVSGQTYYFTVRAISNTFQASQEAYSDGIRVDTSLQVPVKVIPFAPQDSSTFTGIALLAPSAMSVVLRAIGDDGVEVASTSVDLNPAQQSARLISEWFNLPFFDGWVEIQPSGPGLGVYSATGSFDLMALDGVAASALTADAIAMHPGSELIMVNPSTSAAAVVLTAIGAAGQQSHVVPGRSRVKVVLPWIARVTSSLPISIVERMENSGHLSLASPEPFVTRSTLTFAQGVTGAGYTTQLTLVNAGSTDVSATVTFASKNQTVLLTSRSTLTLSLGNLASPAPGQLVVDAVRVSSSTPLELFGAVDIQNPASLVSLGSRSPALEFVFPHVAHGGGLFTGLGFVSGSSATAVTIHVYSAAGDVVKTGNVTLLPNQQLARVLNEIVPGVTIQLGGYIRITADQPLLAWEIYGSDNVFASAPPLPAD